MDLSGNLWTGALPVYAPPATLVSLSFANCPFLSGNSSAIPSWAAPSSQQLLDASLTFQCPQLVIAATGAKFDLPPAYFGYSLCSCVRGFQSGGRPPACSAYPSYVVQNTPAANAPVAFSDGNSRGRLRQGARTQFLVAPPGVFRTIFLSITLLNTANQSGTDYQLSVNSGSQLTAQTQVFQVSSADLKQASTTVLVPVVGSSAVVQYISDADSGPQFYSTFVTSDACPDGYKISGASCSPTVNVPVALLDSAAQAALIALIALCMVLVIYVLSFLVRNRLHRILYSASPLFSALFTLGVGLTLCSALLMTLDKTPSICAAYAWLFNLGFTLAFSSLFVKTWRLYRIFSNTTLQAVTISDLLLLGCVGAALLIDVAVLLTWSFVAPMQVSENPLGQCSSSHTLVFGWILFCVKSALMAAGLVLVYHAQSFPSRFNESRSLIAVSSTTVLAGALWLAVDMGMRSNVSPSVLLVFQIVLVTLQALFAASVMNIPSILSVRADAQEQENLEGIVKEKKRHSLILSSSSALSDLDGNAVDSPTPSRHDKAPLGTQSEAEVLANLAKLMQAHIVEKVKFQRASEALQERRLKMAEVELELADTRAELEYITDRQKHIHSRHDAARLPELVAEQDVRVTNKPDASSFAVSHVVDEKRHQSRLVPVEASPKEVVPPSEDRKPHDEDSSTSIAVNMSETVSSNSSSLSSAESAPAAVELTGVVPHRLARPSSLVSSHSLSRNLSAPLSARGTGAGAHHALQALSSSTSSAAPVAAATVSDADAPVSD